MAPFVPFLVEQNAFSVLAIADRGYVIETGATTLTGSGRELMQNEEAEAAYLGRYTGAYK